MGERGPSRPCPTGAVLNIRGKHFACTQMDHMAPESTDHGGWAHSNQEAEAIWGDYRDYRTSAKGSSSTGETS